MRSKKTNLLIIMLFATTVLFLTACGSVNKIEKALNEFIDETVESWKENENVNSITISGIQDGLKGKNNDYIIIAAGDKEFEKSALSKIYTTVVEEYDGNTFGVLRPLDKESQINYIMVYDESSKKYYNIEVEYKTVDINGSEKEYPYFSNTTEIE